jgi:hypothetical protein
VDGAPAVLPRGGDFERPNQRQQIGIDCGGGTIVHERLLGRDQRGMKRAGADDQRCVAGGSAVEAHLGRKAGKCHRVEDASRLSQPLEQGQEFLLELLLVHDCAMDRAKGEVLASRERVDAGSGGGELSDERWDRDRSCLWILGVEVEDAMERRGFFVLVISHTIHVSSL